MGTRERKTGNVGRKNNKARNEGERENQASTPLVLKPTVGGFHRRNLNYCEYGEYKSVIKILQPKRLNTVQVNTKKVKYDFLSRQIKLIFLQEFSKSIGAHHALTLIVLLFYLHSILPLPEQTCYPSTPKVH